MPAFYHYPEKPVAAVSAAPGKGGDLSITIDGVAQNLIKPESNQHWQAAQKKLGVNLKVKAADGAEYTAMVQTTLAGNKLPDVMMMVPIPIWPKR
jgi:putative aldouronate transport system substrate-binding protein